MASVEDVGCRAGLGRGATGAEASGVAVIAQRGYRRAGAARGAPSANSAAAVGALCSSTEVSLWG